MADRSLQWDVRELAGGIAMASLAVFVVQYVARGFDDNRLTSWQWAFAVVDGPLLFIVLAGGIAVLALVLKTAARLRPGNSLLFALAFASSAVFWPEPEVIVDASRYFTQAKHLELYGVRYFFAAWGREISAWTDMPLIPFFYGIILRTFGESRIWIQVFNSLLFSGSVVLTALIGKALWDEETGFNAGLLLLGIPYLYTQVPLMLVDVPAMFLLVLSVYLFLRALRGGGMMVLPASISITATAYAKYSTWLMLSVVAVAAFVEATRVWSSAADRRRFLRACAGVFFLTAFLGGAMFLQNAHVFTAQMKFLNEYQRPGLQRWGEGFVSTFLFQVHPLVTAAAAVGLIAAARRRDMSFLIACWLIVLVCVLQIRRIRYIVMVFPMLALMASYGTALFREIAVRRFLSLCVVASSLVVAAGAFLPFLKGYSAANLREAGAYLDALPASSVRVFTPLPDDPQLNPAVGVPLLDLFTSKRIIYEYDPEAHRQPLDKIATAALRFTWEYRNPAYYGRGAAGGRDAAVVVISAEKGGNLPPAASDRLAGYRLVKTYEATEGIFSNQTYVRIYQ